MVPPSQSESAAVLGILPHAGVASEPGRVIPWHNHCQRHGRLPVSRSCNWVGTAFKFQVSLPLALPVSRPFQVMASFACHWPTGRSNLNPGPGGRSAGPAARRRVRQPSSEPWFQSLKSGACCLKMTRNLNAAPGCSCVRRQIAGPPAPSSWCLQSLTPLLQASTQASMLFKTYFKHNWSLTLRITSMGFFRALE